MSEYWGSLPAELQICIARMMYKNLWTQSLPIYSIQYTCRKFTTNTIVKIVNSPTRPELKGSLARVIAHRVSALNNETDSQVLICILHNDEHITLPFSVLKQYNDSTDNTNTSSSIAGFRMLHSILAQELKPIYLASFIRLNISIADGVFQMVRGIIAIAVMMSGNSNEAWFKHIYYDVHSACLSRVEFMVSCPYTHRQLKNYLYIALHFEMSAALMSDKMVNETHADRVSFIRRVLAWFAYMDRYYCKRMCLPPLLETIIEGPYVSKIPFNGVRSRQVERDELYLLLREQPSLPCQHLSKEELVLLRK